MAGAGMGLRREIRWIASVHRHKQACRRLVRGRAMQMRPGRYVTREGRVWRHRQHPLPDHVRATKGGGRAGTGRGRPWRQRLKSLVGALVPPWSFTHPGDPEPRYSIAIAAVDGGVVLLDPDDSRSVARCYGSGPLPVDYEEQRERLSRHVATPAFRVGEGREWLFEEFVEGRYLRDLAPAEQEAAVRLLFRDYTELVRAEARNACAPQFRQCAAAVSLDPAAESVLAAARPVLARGGRWPLVPSRPGASVINLVVTEAGRPVHIDLPGVTLAPFFYDPVSLIVSARGALLNTYASGGFDRELGGLFRGAGLDEPQGCWRLPLLATCCLLRPLYQRGRATHPDVSGQNRLVTAGWHGILEALGDSA
jgi:hypothetical protein